MRRLLTSSQVPSGDPEGLSLTEKERHTVDEQGQWTGGGRPGCPCAPH